MNDNNLVQILIRGARQRTARADIVQPPRWTESVNRSWLIKETSTIYGKEGRRIGYETRNR